jgi:hypothetical protein
MVMSYCLELYHTIWPAVFRTRAERPEHLFYMQKLSDYRQLQGYEEIYRSVAVEINWG